jgi:hypothetical protein
MNIELALGLTLMVVGMLLIVAAVFRTLGHAWTFGAYDIWALPVTGILLILVGRWVMG